MHRFYLVDWPVATSDIAVDILSEPLATNKAEIGIQLHPWVNPPYEENVTDYSSFAGNLSPQLEEAKLINLRDAIVKNFGKKPMIYRAGRYGLGKATASILKNAGIPLDSSVRTNFNYTHMGGADYRKHPLAPYWTDGERDLMELPLTTVFWGLLRRQGNALHTAMSRIPHAAGVMAHTGLLERIPLTPEGVSLEEAYRGIDIALDDGLPLLVISLHSPSLAPGNTPYVHSPDDVERLYAWISEVYAYLSKRGVFPTTVSEILQATRA